MTRYIPMILLSVGLNAVAQLLLKKGMASIGHFAFSAGELLRVAPTVAINPFIVSGLLSYVVSVGIWDACTFQGGRQRSVSLPECGIRYRCGWGVVVFC